MSFKFQCWTDGTQEFFRWEADTSLYATKRAIKKDFDFTQSLLEFIDLNTDDLFDICNHMGEVIKTLYMKLDGDIAPLRMSLDKLAERHIYFQFLRLQWFDKLDAYIAGSYGDKVHEFMRYKGLTHVPMNITTAQHQVRFLIDKVLDKDANQEKSVQKGIVNLYGKSSRNETFGFRPLSLGFERMDGSTMAEVLYPGDMIDIVDYLLREIIRRETSFRRCRNCGKYFPLIVHGNTEFCDRLFQDTGRTCREIGSQTKWKEKVAASPAMLLYNKYYKTRFSRIRAGKILRDDFQVWAEKARDMRDLTMKGGMTLEEYEDWLKSGQWM
jgi:hypothetical protein